MARRKKKAISPLLLVLPGVVLGGAALVGVALLYRRSSSLFAYTAGEASQNSMLLSQLGPMQDQINLNTHLAMSDDPEKTYESLKRQ